jgi:two-component system KDP operon response regulator KdpE
MKASSILLVDDEMFIQRLCNRILLTMGLTAVFTSSLEETRKTLGSIERLDLLISDIMLPDGRGSDVVNLVRAKFPKVKVLVITGSSPEIESAAFLALGVKEENIIFKPFSISNFENAVRRQLEDGREAQKTDPK